VPRAHGFADEKERKSIKAKTQHIIEEKILAQVSSRQGIMITQIPRTNLPSDNVPNSISNLSHGFTQNALTLTFQGVNFSLVPSDTNARKSNSVHPDGHQVGNSSNSSAFVSFTNGASTTIHLQSFTGTLVISARGNTGNISEFGLTHANVTPVAAPNDSDIKGSVANARKVEDEPPTPDSYSHSEDSKLEQGQQQLTFQRIPENKKRVSASFCCHFI
jgi:hypothetical protein